MKTKTFSAWVAMDPDKAIPGRRNITVLFARKPKVSLGFWYARKDHDNGRWPIPNFLKLKPGELVRITLEKK